MYNFTLYMTTDCNFKCQYCYEDYHNHYQLNEKTLVDSLEFMMNYGDRGKVLIDFLGGEPLLKKELIYQAVAYIKDNYPEREVKYYITTNCSLMDDRFIAFMKENRFTVRLSFDGNKETHDLNRVAKDEVSCYDKIFENIMKVKDSGLNFSVRMTVTENTIPYMFENICYLHEHGLDNICMIMDVYLKISDAEYVCSFILKENPEAEIILVPIVRKNKKSTVLDMIEGIELLIEEQVDIINMSIGDEYKYHKEIEEVCRAATEKGILIVAAYSNQQVEATYPASFPFVMGVRCLDIENPLQVLQYDGTGTDVIFSSKFFSLYHVGIPKFYQGNSFGCAVITGYLSNYEDEYEQAILQFVHSTLNGYYPYHTLKQKQCYFLTNRIEEPLEQRFIREVTRTERCDTFESGMEKLRNIKTAEQYPVLFIDHNNYQEICEYKDRIRIYAMEHPKTEIVLRYPLFNMVERLDFQKKTNRNLDQFTV